MILKLIDQGIYFIPRFIKALKFMRVSFLEFITQGGISIETLFQYKCVDKNYNYIFRTTIQLDADIINFLPDPDLFKNDANWNKLHKEKCQEHQTKVRKTLTGLDGIYTITWVISAFLSIVSVILLKKTIPFYGNETIFLLIALIALTYIFRTFICNYFFKLIIFLIGFSIRKKVIEKISRLKDIIFAYHV